MADKKDSAEKKAKKDEASKAMPLAAMPFMAYPGFPAMREEMERMMQRFFSDDWMTRMGRFPGMPEWPRMGGMEMPFASPMGAPRADMSESDGEYELTVELPGLEQKDIELTISDDALVLKGEKKAEKETKEKDYHFTERSYGSIRRQFALPRDVDREGMKAAFANGVLKVTLPKSAEAKAKPRRIEVTGG